jgi:uncharacterized protein DUF4919
MRPQPERGAGVSVVRSHHLAVLVLAAALGAGCGKKSGGGARDASGEAGASDVAGEADESTPARPLPPLPARPAEAESDAAYYQERAAVFAQRDASVLEGTDFVRFRRGRLYAPHALDAKEALSLDKRLVVASGARDHQATVDLSDKLLADDQTDVHAHLARSVALRKLGRGKEADFHFALARQLSQSILGSGDGKSAESAYTVYSLQEERAVLKVTGYGALSQSLLEQGGRAFDVVKARATKGGASAEIYFDVSELHAEQQRQPASH